MTAFKVLSRSSILAVLRDNAVSLDTFSGADNTGVTASDGAFALAVADLTSRGGGVIKLRPGTYLLSAALLITATNIVIEGSGRSATTIAAGAGIGTSAVVRFSSAASSCGVRDLSMTASASDNGAVLQLAGVDSFVERVTITGPGSGSTGPVKGLLVDSTALRFRAKGCTVTGIINPLTTFGHGTGINVAADDSVIEDCSTYSNGTTYYAQQAGIFVTGTTGVSGRRIAVRNCHSYSNGVHGLYATGCDYINITGGSYHTNGAVATAAGGAGGSDFGRGITIGSSAALAPRIAGVSCYSNEENGIIISGAGSGTGASDTSPIIGAVVDGAICYNNNVGLYAGGHGIEHNGYGGSVCNCTCYGNHNGISISGAKISVHNNRSYKNTSSDTTAGCGISFNYQQGVYAIASVTTTNASTSITVASGGFPSVVEGNIASGTGIATGSFVRSISGNTIVLSAAATATGTVTVTFTSILSENSATQNKCWDNDNFGIKAAGNGTHYGLVICNNQLHGNALQGRGSTYDLATDNTAKYGTYRDNFTNNASALISIADTFPNRGGNQTISDNALSRTLSYSASISWFGDSSQIGLLSVTDTSAFTINAPQFSWVGRRVTYRITNNSGGAMGTITWGGTFMRDSSAWTNPASTKTRTVSFIYDGSKWVQDGAPSGDLT